MERLPLILDTNEAIDYFRQHPDCTDAVKSYVVAFLYGEGFKNASIRAALNIDKVYLVTHLKRAGTLLSETELELWHNNSKTITLGHVRAIARLPRAKREPLLRGLLTRRTPVSRFELLGKGEECEKDVDIKRYEEVMQNVTGRVTKIRYNNAKRSGTISLDFFSLDALDDISKALGFNAEDHQF
jgi:ParB family chromosome partitioning protein